MAVNVCDSQETSSCDRVNCTGEIDGTVVVGIHLVDHILQLRFGRVLAQRAHDGAQLLGGDLACSHGSQYLIPSLASNSVASQSARGRSALADKTALTIAILVLIRSRKSFNQH